MRATRRDVLRWGVAGGVAALAAGCGRDGSKPAAAGSVTVGTALDVINMDPYQQSLNSLILLRNLNAWLVNYDEQLRPQPDALTSFRIAADRTSVTLRLRDDVVFSTGKRMSADDVLAALERARDPEEGFNLVGAMAIVDDFRATAKDTVVITFKEPTAPSLITDLLAGQPILDADKNNAADLAGEPASAGPYRLSDWRQGERLVLEADPQWYKGAVANQRAVLQIFTNTNAMLSALQSGSVDAVTYLPPKDGERIEKDFGVLGGYPGAATMLLRVNTQTPPFDNVVLRQAIQRAVDRDRVVRQVMFGYGGAANLPWGPESPANDPGFYDQVSFDLDAARRLLDDSGAARSGAAIVDGSDPVTQLVIQAIQADLDAIGFDLQIDKLDTGTFQSRLPTGLYGLALGQIGGGQLSSPRIVQNSLFRLSENPLWPDGVPPKDYGSAIESLITTSEPTRQAAAYDLLNQTLVEQAWAIGIYYVPTLFAHKRALHGLRRDFQNALVLADASF